MYIEQFPHSTTTPKALRSFVGVLNYFRDLITLFSFCMLVSLPTPLRKHPFSISLQFTRLIKINPKDQPPHLT